MGPAVILVTFNIYDMMTLVLATAVSAALRLHRPVGPGSDLPRGRRQAAQVIVIFLSWVILGIPLEQGLAADFNHAL